MMLIEVRWSQHESSAFDKHHLAILMAGSIDTAIKRVRKRMQVADSIKMKGKIICNSIYYDTWIGDPK